MDIKKLLEESTHKSGASGQETGISAYYAELFRPFCTDVRVDSMFNVIAHRKGTGPKVMLSAHQDEICTMVSKIEEDGSLRLGRVGGVDPRILPASRLTVHTSAGNIPAVCGCTPPEVLGKKGSDHAYDITDVFADTGYPAQRVKEMVKVGDIVTFDVPLTILKNNQASCKTLDDRACVAILLCCAERLMKLKCDADVYFVASSQEEVGAQGAQTAAFSIHPDLAVALDVDFARQPGVSPDESLEIDSVSVTQGPFVAQKLLERMENCAKNHCVKLQKLISPSYTGTDTDEIAAAADGIPSVLLCLPQKYMHTTVETVDMGAIEEGGRLLAYFLSELDGDWGKDLWL